MKRRITDVYRNSPVVENGLMRLYRLLPTDGIQSLGPFVFLDYYTASGGKGIGQNPHPHAGIEILSYLLQGHGEHRDSRGFVDRIASGEAQYIKAGSGILHAETPLEPIRQGLQLWLSMPPEHMFDEPAYVAYRAASIPVIYVENSEIKVIAGEVNSMRGPVTTVNDSCFAHVRLNAEGEVTLKVDSSMELGVMVLNGEVFVSNEAVSLGDLAFLSGGDEVTLKASGGKFPVDVAILGGAKINYPIVFHGPFVMDSMDSIRRAYASYLSGSMGQLS